MTENRQRIITADEMMKEVFGDLEYKYTWEEAYYDMLNDVAAVLDDYRLDHTTDGRAMSQVKLAQIMEVSQVKVSRYQSGEYNMTLKSIAKDFSKLGIVPVLKFYKMEDAKK